MYLPPYCSFLYYCYYYELTTLAGLQLIDDVPGGLGLGWDPTASAGEPAYRITRIFVEDCRVFRTKARSAAPFS